MSKQFVATVPLQNLVSTIANEIYKQTRRGGGSSEHSNEVTATDYGRIIFNKLADLGEDRDMMADARQVIAEGEAAVQERFDIDDDKVPAHAVAAVCVWPRDSLTED